MADHSTALGMTEEAETEGRQTAGPSSGTPRDDAGLYLRGEKQKPRLSPGL